MRGIDIQARILNTARTSRIDVRRTASLTAEIRDLTRTMLGLLAEIRDHVREINPESAKTVP